MRPEQSKLYNTQRWRRMSRVQLQLHPLCEDCGRRGITTVADQVDHVEPHRGDPQKFWSSPLASLCRACHGLKTAREQGKTGKRSVATDGTPDGW